MKAQTFGPNPYGDQSQGWSLLAVCWAFVTCAFITTVMRIWIRSRLTRNLGSDDWLMAFTMFTTVIGAAFVTVGVLNGVGRHEYYLTPAQRRVSHALGWADWVQTFTTLALVKISICLFLLRIVDSRNLKRGLYALIGFTALFTAICVFLFFGACRPLKAYWVIGVDGKCLSNQQLEAILIAQGILSVITDLICAALPVIFLRNLQINIRTKIGLCLLMGLGVITALCCTVRTALSAGATTDPDTTWSISANLAWRLPEVNIGIVCANAPLFRPLYLYMRGRLATQIRSKATSSANDGLSKERTWPANAANAMSPRWAHGSEDTAVELEMGLPVHEGGGGERRSQSLAPLNEKVFFTFPAERT